MSRRAELIPETADALADALARDELRAAVRLLLRAIEDGRPEALEAAVVGVRHIALGDVLAASAKGCVRAVAVAVAVDEARGLGEQRGGDRALVRMYRMPRTAANKTKGEAA